MVCRLALAALTSLLALPAPLAAQTSHIERAARGLRAPIYWTRIAEADTTVLATLRAFDATAQAAGLVPFRDSTVATRRTLRAGTGTFTLLVEPLPRRRALVTIVGVEEADGFGQAWNRWRIAAETHLARPGDTLRFTPRPVALWNDGAPGACSAPDLDDMDEARITRPEKKSGDYPEYPRQVRGRDFEARTVVRAHVSSTGAVRCLQGLALSFAEVSASVVRAVQAWRFTPTRVDGAAVESWMTIPIRFRLQ